mmetsp:Transcript_70469/g.196585  ORF Transcript_70469/g.196585 Transcript_70469/m.196585 type:complete len:193 (-) Transcript_70469:317-895(-)
MFNCRMCAEGPFAALFDQGDDNDKKDQRDKKKKGKGKRSTTESKRDEASFRPRTEQENQALVKEWSQYAHPRAKEFFQTEDVMMDVLMQLASGIDRDSDPVLGPDDQCVVWYGDVTKDDQQAAIRMVKPGESSESVTYVNRVLAFIFATDESFEQLMKLPKEPFKMNCGDQLCVHLAHISLAVEGNGAASSS